MFRTPSRVSSRHPGIKALESEPRPYRISVDAVRKALVEKWMGFVTGTVIVAKIAFNSDLSS